MFWKTHRAVLAIALFLCSCGSADDTIDLDPRVIASVGDHEISVSWFERTYVDHLIQTGQNDTPGSRWEHLDNLIDEILLAGEAKDMGITETRDFRLFKERELRRIVGARFFEREFLETLPPPTEEEIRQVFVRWKDQPIVRHLVYSTPEEAEAAYERLASGKDFLEEAQDCYGLARVDSTAGYLGAIRYFGVDDAFAEAAFSLEAGSFSRPVRTRFGYHIIRVEDWIREPLLTESEYETRRPGLESQFRLRRRRLEGDRFIRSFMEETDVIADADAIEALQLLLRDFAVDVAPRPTVDLTSEGRFRVDSLRTMMNTTTVLATYRWNGRLAEFTAGDYLFWLDTLPFQEALNRTAASVGRAMRNELLAMAGVEAGLDDGVSTARLERKTLTERARLVRQSLRQRTDVELDEELIEETFDRLGIERRRLYRADFDVVEFETIGEANRLQAVAENDPDAIALFEDVVHYNDVDLANVPEWQYHVSSVPENEPVVVGTARGWSVIVVRRRDRIELNWEEHRNQILQRLQPYAAEYQTVKTLRDTVPIDVDAALFEQIMASSVLNSAEDSSEGR